MNGAHAAVVGKREEGVLFRVLVVPRASRTCFGPVSGQAIRVAVTAPPTDGRANEAVVALVARALGVSKSAVAITAGVRSKRKTVYVAGITLVDLTRCLDQA